MGKFLKLLYPPSLSLVHLGSFQAYGLDFYFAQMWVDKRFVSRDHKNCIINMIGQEVEKVWLPDTVFVNSKSSKFHDVTVNNRFLSINMDDGSVMYHVR